MNTLPRPLLKILFTVLFVITIAPDLHAEKRVGVIMTGDIPYYAEIHEAFVTELNRRLAGRETIEIILQRPFPDPISWSNSARKLIAHDVDLIVTYGSPATQAAIDEKSRIPQVYAGLYEPEYIEIKAGNVTGCGFKVPLSSILRYLKQMKQVENLGIIYSSIEEDSVRQYKTMQSIASEQNVTAQTINIRTQDDLDKLKTIKADAVFITGSSIAHIWLDEIIEILDDRKVPTAGIFPDINESGLLMTLYKPPKYQGEMAAEMASLILLEGKSVNISSHVFRDTELDLNMVEAKHLGINFPIQLLIEATRVIE